MSFSTFSIREKVEKIKSPFRIIGKERIQENEVLFERVISFFHENFPKIAFLICEDIDANTRFFHVHTSRTHTSYKPQETQGKIQYRIDLSPRHAITFHIGDTHTSDIEIAHMKELFEEKDVLFGIQNELIRIYDDNNDHLTELYNGKFVEKAIANNLPRSVIFIDLNKFKELNDTHGHAAGDERLRDFAHILRQSVRSTGGDEACRRSGDEFIILVNSSERHVIEDILGRIQYYVNEFNIQKEQEYEERAIPLGKQLSPLSISTGYTLYNPGVSLEEAVHTADKSMLKNKLVKGGEGMLYRLLGKCLQLLEEQKEEIVL